MSIARMPALSGLFLHAAEDAATLVGRQVAEHLTNLDKRVQIPCCNSSSPPGLVQAATIDPWQKSGKYALGWTYFAIIILVLTTALRWYNYWTDKIRVALHKESEVQSALTASPNTEYELYALHTGKSTQRFFPREGPLPDPQLQDAPLSSFRPFNAAVGLSRLIAYHPIPALRVHPRWKPLAFPSIGVLVLVLSALTFAILYCFVPQPLYWQSIGYGSPPLAIRSGMIAVAMMPWIVALSMKANFISMLTGIGHERLNVLHRWLAYLCLLLSLNHTIPFYMTPTHDQGGLQVFRSYFSNTRIYIYGTGEFCCHHFETKFLTACRNCCARATGFLVRTLSATPQASILRAVCDGPRAGRYLSPGHAILALPQLPHILGLPLCDSGCLATFLHRSPVVLELDHPVANVVPGWRRVSLDTATGKRYQNHHSDTDEVETWPIRISAHAWRGHFREPSLHSFVALQR